MQYLHKLYSFDPLKSEKKLELMIGISSIDYLTWHKKENSEATTIHTNISVGDIKMNHVADGLPENINQISFDGAFFKATAHYVGSDGGMKKYSCWINTDNIGVMFSSQPDSSTIYFRSGSILTIANKLHNLISGLLEHNKQLKQRKELKYGKK